jgi:DNA-directed RNA polymerase specialized sigma24 family protein
MHTNNKHSEYRDSSEYATRSDFCTIFVQHQDRLYSLALLLTGEEELAERCVLTALDSCSEASQVFKHSAISWSRRAVIVNAIRLSFPVSCTRSLRRPISTQIQTASLKSVQELPDFERFVFVMSVLESFSDHECFLLLNCARSEILPARTRALRQISMAAEKSNPVHGNGAQRFKDADWFECGWS